MTVNIFIALLVQLLLATPILAIYKLSMIKTERAVYASIGVLIVFSLVFAGTMCALTIARHEVFAAAAAYCAILVVFIRSTTPRDSDRSRTLKEGRTEAIVSRPFSPRRASVDDSRSDLRTLDVARRSIIHARRIRTMTRG